MPLGARYCISILLSLFLCSFSTPEGMRYQLITTDIPQSIHVFEVNPKKFVIVPARALDKCVGRESVLSLSTRKGAIGAVNGGFFSIGGNHDGSPCGILANGNWVFVVIDGKQPHLSLGMTMNELADLMESLGCIEALNLDGGGSSTFVYQDEVINQPTGDGDANDDNLYVLRPVSDAILIMGKR